MGIIEYPHFIIETYLSLIFIWYSHKQKKEQKRVLYLNILKTVINIDIPIYIILKLWGKNIICDFLRNFPVYPWTLHMPQRRACQKTSHPV